MSITDLRKFTPKGTEEFRSLIESAPSDLSLKLSEIIYDDSLTASSKLPNLSWELPTTRLEIGRQLYPFLNPSGPLRMFALDMHLWNWISAVYLSNSSESRSLALSRKDAWVFNGSSQRFYRHVFFSAYFMYEHHEEDPGSVGIILDTPIAKSLGEIGENILATPDIAYSVGAKLAHRLYFDPASGAPKIGASSKGPGTVRRLSTAFLNQIRLNVDFKEMSVEQIWVLLPPEFDKFKTPSTGLGAHVTPDWDESDLRSQLGL
jgi:hypothetical protein